jgi:hypothetical protein
MIVDHEVCSLLGADGRSGAAMPPRRGAPANRPMAPAGGDQGCPAERLRRVVLSVPTTGRDDGSVEQGEPLIKSCSLEWDKRLRRRGQGDCAGGSEGKQSLRIVSHKRRFDMNSPTNLADPMLDVALLPGSSLPAVNVCERHLRPQPQQPTVPPTRCA